MNEKYKGPKLFIYSRKGEPNGLEKVEGKRSLESWISEPKKRMWEVWLAT